MTSKTLIMSDRILSTLNLPQVQDIVAQLPHHATKVWPKRDFNRLEGIVIHHAASEAPIRNQALYHVNSHGWAGIAYTFCIQNGQIFQTNYIDDRTTHASGANDIAFGICVVGDLSKRSITDFERRAITGLVLMLKEEYPHLWVKGHNAVTATSCPCTDMNVIRKDIETAERNVMIATSKQKQDEIIYMIMNQMSLFYNYSRGKNPDGTSAVPGNIDWGTNMILSLEPEFRKRGFLK